MKIGIQNSQIIEAERHFEEITEADLNEILKRIGEQVFSDTLSPSL